MNKAIKSYSFKMPGEFEKQKSVWIVWPHNKKDWPGYFTSIPETIAKVISKLSISQKVNLIIRKKENENEVKKLLKKKISKNLILNFIELIQIEYGLEIRVQFT